MCAKVITTFTKTKGLDSFAIFKEILRKWNGNQRMNSLDPEVNEVFVGW